MKYCKTIIRYLVLALFIMAAMPAMSQQRIYLHSGWRVSPNADGSESIEAIVPGTTFSSYVAAGKESDPNFGDNIHNVERAKYDRDFYYTCRFTVDSDMLRGRLWLCMNGVNRSADIRLNGNFLGHLDGFMHRGRFDITRLVKAGGSNVVDVRVSIPQMPLANEGSPNYLSSGGWDWVPYVPGLNSGITDKVWIESTGDVVIRDPWVRTKLPTLSRADISVATDLYNASDSPRKVNIRCSIAETDIRFEQQLTIKASSMQHVDFTSRLFPQLLMSNPKLWWPNGMGDANLYTLRMEVVEEDGKVSDRRDVRFGVREYSYDTDGGVFHLKINNRRVFVKGANWGMSEYMLRCRGKEYALKVRLHREMHFNMIRNWLGSVTDEEFYDCCDEMGIMVWDDFWLNSNPTLPYDIHTFNMNAVEKIKRLRNHPSIAVWCGDNEGTPEPPLCGWLAEDIRTFDGGDRYFMPQSNNGVLSGSGYWGAFDSRYYFSRYPDSTTAGKSGRWGFRTEIGTAVVPNYESLRKFMPADHLWPIDEMWNKHYFGSNAGNALPDKYMQMVTDWFGAPTDAADFCRKAQFVNLESNRAMYEGWLDHMWDDASGIMTWMGQSAYPSMVWQTYDYYYDLTGAYFGCRQACEPLHIFWNPVTDDIKIANTSGSDAHGLHAEAEVYDMSGQIVDSFTMRNEVDVPMSSTSTVFTLPFNKERKVLSTGCRATASSTAQGSPADAFDGDESTRWAAIYGENEWLMVDLGEEKSIGGIRLNWEAAYGKSYKIQVSNDMTRWTDVYKTNSGTPGIMENTFPEVKSRYVRMLGIELGWWYGYSLWSMDVLGGVEPTAGLSDVHFVNLRLKDARGNIISENNYWRGNDRTDFRALNTLRPVTLNIKSRTSTANENTFITATVTLPKSAPNVAFGTHLQLLDKTSGASILPAIFSQNYFTLRPGESRTVTIEVESRLLKGGFTLKATPYNNK